MPIAQRSAARPPLWLAAGALASAWAALYTTLRWVIPFVLDPVHDDVRLSYAAAQAGLRDGWSTIYDAAVSTSAPGAAPVDAFIKYDSTPFLAWLFAPLTAFPEPVAYAIWTAVSFAALLLAWHIAAPYDGLRKLTLLLLAIGLWPALLVFYFGQPTMIVVALVCAAWWFLRKEQVLSAGVALAFATFLKPQAVLLLPLALLVSGRYRVVVSWIAIGGLLAIATAFALGVSGIAGWLRVLIEVQGQAKNTEYTLVGLLGSGVLTYALWAVQALTAMVIARRNRAELEIVFAAGLLGTAATASYFHAADSIMLVPVGWFVLRTATPLWHRLWLLAGVAPMQMIALGITAPLLVWMAAWLAILAFPFPRRNRASASQSESPRRSPHAEIPDADAELLKR